MCSYCNFSSCSQGRVEKYGFTVELDEAEYHSEIEMNEANEFIAWSDGMRFYHSHNMICYHSLIVVFLS